MATVPTPKRSEVWLVRFDPSAGAEIRKVRPAVVVNLYAIGRLPLRIVVPVTDWKSDFGNLSWFVCLPAASENGLSKDSGADAFQVKSVPETRFVRKLGEVTGAQIDEIAAAIAVRRSSMRIENGLPRIPPPQAAVTLLKGRYASYFGRGQGDQPTSDDEHQAMDITLYVRKLLTTHFRTSSTASIATMNGTMNSHTRPGIGAVPKIARPHGV